MAVRTSEIADYEYHADALDDLVLPEKHKSLLKALCDSRRVETVHRTVGSLGQDRLKTKEGSRVILLHGFPVLGKAFTVGGYGILIIKAFALHMTECVANYSRCPLIKLTARDLTSEAQVVDETLRKYFKLASSWGAIVLLDKVEIVLLDRDRGKSAAAGWYLFLLSVDYLTD